MVQQRWPQGFVCPQCAHTGHCHLKGRDVFQCNRCKCQVSPTSGTVFAESKLPLRTWFLAMYLLTQHKNGISALSLRRQLGVSPNTAWLLKHKLMQTMVERDEERPLGGHVQIDDAYWGGERHGGGRGRGSPGKTPFVAAVQCTPQGQPVAMRMDVVAGFRKTELAAWAQRYLMPGSAVVSDGLGCFPGVVAEGCTHEAIVTGGGVPTEERFAWVNNVGNQDAFCAKRDGTTEAEFALRHVASVQRLMAMEGLVLDAASLETYAGFARSGGEISFGGQYVTPLPSEIYYEARETGAALTRMHGIFEREGRKTVAVWSQTNARPLPGLETMATFAAMQKEPGYVAAVVGSAAGSVAVAAPAVAQPPAAVVPVAPVVAAAPAPAAAFEPAPAPAAAPAVLARPGDEIAWEDLPRYIDRDFEITTSRMGKRDVVLVAASADEIMISGSVAGGGRAQNRVYRDGFGRAVLIR